MAPAETAEQSLRFAEFELQPSTGRLLRHGRPVAIEPKAFDLLLLLARERGRLVEKEEILEAVWDGSFVTDNALTRTVTRLRKSLGDSAREPRFVETVHTRGYRFLAEVEVVSGSVRAPVERTGWPTRHLPWLVAAAAVILLALALAWLVPWPASEGPAAVAAGELDRRRVAVLPIRNLSGAEEDDYLVDGLTEQIISILARIDDLRVLAGATTEAYRDRPGRIVEVARELGSGTVLEGSARRSGDRLRIAVQLIDGATEEHLWSGEFDRSMDDLFAIQSEIATRVAEELQLSISELQVNRIRSGPTRSMNAYELYLKGREAYRTRTRVGNEEALAFYNAALEIDPDFALAEAGRANAFATRSIHYGFSTENEEEAVRSAERALGLNPELPEAHKALGIVALRQDRMADAIRHNREALELNPSYDEALYNLSSALHMTGQWHEALRIQLRETSLPVSRQALAAQLLQLGLVEEGERLAEQALSESPLPAYLTVHLALEDARAGDFEGARQRLTALQDARPELSGVWEVSGMVEALAGDRAAAAGHFERAQVAWGDRGAEALTNLARAAWLRGDAEATDRLCDELEGKLRPHIDRGSEFWFHPWAMALVEAMRGNLEVSVEWYERAVDLGYRRYWPDEALPVFAALRGEPRFQAQLERMRRSIEEMREAVRDDAARAVERLTAS